MCLAVPGRILEIEGDDPLLRAGRVDFAGTVKRVNLAYVPEAKIGDYVLVHVGFAIRRIPEDEIEATYRFFADVAATDPDELEGLARIEGPP